VRGNSAKHLAFGELLPGAVANVANLMAHFSPPISQVRRVTASVGRSINLTVGGHGPSRLVEEFHTKFAEGTRKFVANLRRGIAGERAMNFGGTPPRFAQTKRERSTIKQTIKVAYEQINILPSANARLGVLVATKRTNRGATMIELAMLASA
jgi:hypothetical protein